MIPPVAIMPSMPLAEPKESLTNLAWVCYNVPEGDHKCAGGKRRMPRQAKAVQAKEL